MDKTEHRKAQDQERTMRERDQKPSGRNGPVTIRYVDPDTLPKPKRRPKPKHYK